MESRLKRKRRYKPPKPREPALVEGAVYKLNDEPMETDDTPTSDEEIDCTDHASIEVPSTTEPMDLNSPTPHTTSAPYAPIFHKNFKPGLNAPDKMTKTRKTRRRGSREPPPQTSGKA